MQRRNRERASKVPTLPTIPEAEASLATTNQCLSCQRNGYLNLCKRCRHRHQPEKKRTLKSKHNKHANNRYLRRLQLCLLILAPGHIILYSLLLLHQPLNHSSLRSPLHLSPNSYHGKRRKDDRYITINTNTNTKTKLRKQANLERKPSGRMMSTKRVYFMDPDQTWLGNIHEFEVLLDDNTTLKRYQSDISSPYEIQENDCEPMAKWQTMSFPTCNSLHEIDIFSTSPETYSTKLLGHGWFRNAWEVKDSSLDASVAIKTLKLERDFLPEYYELHRRDAVSMERLTSSPYVMDVFGYCGQSALTELAFSENGMNNLYRVSTGLKGIDTPYVLQTKLQIAALISLGLAHIHNVPLDDNQTYVNNQPATITHYDINPRNVIMTKDGTPKINDFNVAEFMKETISEEPCGFESRLHEPWWRAPEEMIVYSDSNSTTTDENADIYPKKLLSEKVDIYSLGNTLFVLLTGLEPRGKEHKQRRLKQVSNLVAEGDYPQFPVEYESSTDPAVVAIRQAIISCWQHNPSLRPSAVEIATRLFLALDQIKQQMTNNTTYEQYLT